MEINIDREIDNHKCPTISLCSISTTCYSPIRKRTFMLFMLDKLL